MRVLARALIAGVVGALLVGAPAWARKSKSASPADIHGTAQLSKGSLTSGDEQLSAFAVDDTHVYWAATLPDGQGSRINRSPLAGGQVEELVRGAFTVGALGLSRDALLWIERPLPCGAHPVGTVRLMERALPRGTPRERASSISGMSMLTVTPTGALWVAGAPCGPGASAPPATLTWLDEGATAPQALGEAPCPVLGLLVEGGGVTTLSAVPPAADSTAPFDVQVGWLALPDAAAVGARASFSAGANLARTAHGLAYTDWDRIRQVYPAPRAATGELASIVTPPVVDLAVADEVLYWVEGTARSGVTLWRQAVSGGEPERVHTVQAMPIALVVTASQIHWVLSDGVWVRIDR